MINMELDNMRMLAGVKKKKKKGKKKKKSKKAKKPKHPARKLPGFKLIAGRDPYDLLVDLIQNNIVKKLPPSHLNQFLGEFNYIASMLDNIEKTPFDPSMALIRQLVTEYIIFPLGSKLIRERTPDLDKAFLFYGPAGTGKTQVVRAVATETNSVVFDLSPLNIESVYYGSDGTKQLVATAFIVAREYQPSLIYIDECEKVWPKK